METDDRQARLDELARQIAEVQARAAVEPEPLRRPAPVVAANSAVLADPAPDDDGGARRPAQPGAAGGRCEGHLPPVLSVAPRPRAGLAQALHRKDIPQDVASAVLDRFTEIGLIDDVAYAQSYVRVKHRDRALGRAALRTELRKLGVDEEVMSDAVKVVDTEAERARAAELVDKRIDAAMAAGPVAARRRLLGLLDRRGYPAEVAVPVVESALQAYAVDPE